MVILSDLSDQLPCEWWDFSHVWTFVLQYSLFVTSVTNLVLHSQPLMINHPWALGCVQRHHEF